MKIKNGEVQAFTITELAVILGIFALFVLVVAPLMGHGHCRCKAVRIQCVNNQKQIGIAYRIWSGDNGDRMPNQVTSSSTNSGWGDFVKFTNAGVYCWSNYAIIQNELGQSPKVLICPDDKRKPAKDFQHLKNENISYFFGAGANENFPMSIAGGDRNLSPGLKPKNDYGFSPGDNKGNDVILRTNSPVCWSLKMHSTGNGAGAGNVLLGDGSVQQVSSARFMSDLQYAALDAGNFPPGYVNQNNSYRLIFP
jgi:hypothetical protein